MKKDPKTPDNRFESATKRTRGSANAGAFPFRLNFLPRPSKLGIKGVIPPSGQQIIAEGWQGVFRHAVLEAMPVGELADLAKPV